MLAQALPLVLPFFGASDLRAQVALAARLLGASAA